MIKRDASGKFFTVSIHVGGAKMSRFEMLADSSTREISLFNLTLCLSAGKSSIENLIKSKQRTYFWTKCVVVNAAAPLAHRCDIQNE